MKKEQKQETAAKMLVIGTDVNIHTPEIKNKIEQAEVVFVGLKLIKNTSKNVYDRVGTLIARFEIEKIKHKFSKTEIETI